MIQKRYMIKIMVFIGLLLTVNNLLEIKGQASLLDSTSDVSWLEVGAYAEYGPGSPEYPMIVITYNQSLDVVNCSLWKDGGFSETHPVEPEEVFKYRFEVLSRSGSNVSLRISIEVTNWLDSEYSLIINQETGEVYSSSMALGHSCLWLTDTNQDASSIIASNTALGFEVEHAISAGSYGTLQGQQLITVVETSEIDYRPPLSGERSIFSNTLVYDLDTGLLLAGFRQLVLPIDSEARLITFWGEVILADTNIDLGPSVIDPASFLPGLLLLVAMVVLMTVLTITFYYGRTKRYTKKKIKRKKKR